MKKNIFFIILPIAIFAGLVIFRNTVQKTEGEVSPEVDKIMPAKIQFASESKSIVIKNEYPATIGADQEATITAKTSGTVTAVNFDLGKYVGSGSLLVRIDDTSANLATGDNNLKSAQVKQLEIAVQEAERSLKLAKKNESEDSTSATRAAEDIAKLQLENAKVALSSALDSHNVIAPISGSVTSKNVSVGDSISQGQTLATISKTGQIKLTFFVEQDKINSLTIGDKILATTPDNISFEAVVSNIAPQADSVTKRFQVDAKFTEKINLKPGTIISVKITREENVSENKNVILPLSAITIAQNENYLFVVENDLAKKINFEIVRIFGENAELKADIADNAQIVIEGNKLLKDGSKIKILN